jgi:predicted nucleotidyltransferase
MDIDEQTVLEAFSIWTPWFWVFGSYSIVHQLVDDDTDIDIDVDVDLDTNLAFFHSMRLTAASNMVQTTRATQL